MPSVRPAVDETLARLVDEDDDEVVTPEWFLTAGPRDSLPRLPLTSPSGRWRFPYDHYSFTRTFRAEGAAKNVTALVVVVNTVRLSGVIDWLDDADVNTERHVEPLSPPGRDLQGDWAWFERVLETSTADWVIVAGHYPLWSATESGPTLPLLYSLEGILGRAGAAFYLSGAHHNLQLHAPKPVASRPTPRMQRAHHASPETPSSAVAVPTLHVNVGLGGENLPGQRRLYEAALPRNALQFFDPAGGFAAITLDDDTHARLDFFHANGTRAHSVTHRNPRRP